MKHLSITFLNQVRLLLGLIVISLLYLPFIGYVYLKFGTDKAIYVFLPYLIIFLIPVLYLHFTYYFKSNNFTYLIGEGNFIQVDLKRNEKYFKEEDIYEINIYMNGNRLRNESFRRFPFQDYYYSEIELKNGRKILITCLHSYDLDKYLIQYLKNIKIKKHVVFYPMLSS